MNLISVIVVFVVFFICLIIPFQKYIESQKSKKKFDYKYKKLKFIFTRAERSFFGVLNNSINDDVVVFGKVRVADVIRPDKAERAVWQKAFNKISAKHFDFVLCKKSDLSFICAIELDDKSHNTAKRKSRDTFLESACESAGLELIRFPAKATYSIADIRESLSICLHVGE